MRSNTYEYSFTATCPNDGTRIGYSLRIVTQGEVIMTEDIEAACRHTEPAYHEDIADRLHARFGGQQTLVATHGDVRVTTHRVAVIREAA